MKLFAGPLAAAVALAGVGLAFAQAPTPGPPMPAPLSPSKARGVAVVKAAPINFPDEAVATGEQGAPIVGLMVGADGSVGDVHILKTSYSERLDAAAMDLVKASTFRPATDADGHPIAQSFQVTVEYYKDSVEDPKHLIGNKVCAELQTDLAWYAKTYPGKSQEEFRLYRMMAGIVSLSAMQKGTTTALSAIKAFPSEWAKTVEACQAKPRAGFMDTFKRFHKF